MSHYNDRRKVPKSNPSGKVQYNKKVGNKTRQKLRQFEQQVKENATYETKTNTNVGKIQNISEHEREALEYKKFQEQQKILRQKRKERIKSLMQVAVKYLNILKKNIFFIPTKKKNTFSKNISYFFVDNL